MEGKTSKLNLFGRADGWSTKKARESIQTHKNYKHTPKICGGVVFTGNISVEYLFLHQLASHHTATAGAPRDSGCSINCVLPGAGRHAQHFDVSGRASCGQKAEASLRVANVCVFLQSFLVAAGEWVVLEV